MKDPFFLSASKSKAKPSKPRPKKDEEIVSEESDYESDSPRNAANNEKGSRQKSAFSVDLLDEQAEESTDKKRLRLAKQYLHEIAATESTGVDADDADREIISRRLKHDQLEMAGRLFRYFAASVKSDLSDADIVFFGRSPLPTTGVCINEEGTVVFSCAKNGSVTMWDVAAPKPTKLCSIARSAAPVAKKGAPSAAAVPRPHTDQIWGIDLAPGGKFLATAGKDRLVNVYNVDMSKKQFSLAKSFLRHRDAVTDVSFRRSDANQLFSASLDRSVIVWNLENMSYVESLFGHQEGIVACDSFLKERCVTVAGRDKSLHLYKVVDQSQLIFRVEGTLPNVGSIDCVRMLDEEHFVCGTDNGTLLIFHIAKKKPVFVRENAHEDGGAEISALSSVSQSDIVVSGSASGSIRVWQLDEKKTSLTLKAQIKIDAFPNDISCAYNGKYAVIAAGKEPRLGRWNKQSAWRNGCFLLRLLH